jgi:hypothetical protein
MFAKAGCMSVCLNKFIANGDLTPINPTVYLTFTKLTYIYGLTVQESASFPLDGGSTMYRTKMLFADRKLE